MNIRDLEYVAAVARHRHFGRAAEACNVSQPTLSAQIAKLEERLGHLLFERARRQVTPTPLGAQVVTHAGAILEHVRAITALARAAGDPLAGMARLGVIPTLGPYLLPRVLKPLRRELPRLHLELVEEQTAALTRRLLARELDAALFATAPDDPALDAIPLCDEPFWVVLPRDHPLAARDAVTPRDLAALDLMLLADGHCLRDQALALCGGRADGAFSGASLETVLQAAAAGYGCTLVPAMALGGAWSSGQGLIARPIAAKSAARRVALVFRRSFPNRALLDALAATIARHLPNTVRRSAPTSRPA